MNYQILYLFLFLLVSFVVLGFSLNKAIKKHDEQKAKAKKKKGRTKNLPQSKNKF